MVGMIVTGHGSFATGIISGVQLLAGELEACKVVDFKPEDTIESLTEKLEAAVGELSECEGIVIYADLVGGSPFNVAIRMKLERSEHLEVIGGANLPAVLDGYMSRMMLEDAAEIAKKGQSAGREAMTWYVASTNDDDDEYEE